MEYKGVALGGGATTNCLLKSAAASTMLKPEATSHDIIIAEEIYVTANNAYLLQEIVDEVAVEQMEKCFGEQWIAEINYEYVGFSNQAIKSFNTYV